MNLSGQGGSPGAPRVVRILVSVGLGGMFLLAAVGKTIQPEPFLRLVAFLIPEGAHVALAHWWIGGVVVGLEFFLGVCLLLGARTRVIVGLAFVTLLAFSGVLIWIAQDPAAPGCGCMGIFAAAQAASQSPAQGLIRNGAMVFMSAWLWFAVRPSNVQRADDASQSVGARPERSDPTRRGFALVELLVCLALVAVFLSLVLPSLRKTGESAQLASSLSMNRQLVACVAMYSGDYDNGLPYLGTPGEPFGPITAGGVRVSWNGYFRDQGLFWLTQVFPSYYSGPRAAVEYLTWEGKPNNEPWGEPVIVAKFQLSHTVFARPEFWSENGAASRPEYDWTLLRGTRQNDIRFPSDKGLIVDMSIGFLRGEGDGPDGVPVMPAGFCDGSALAKQVDGEDFDTIVRRPLAAFQWPLFATRDGLAGRDRR